MKNIHAYTEPTPERGSPAYVSINRHPGGRCTLTVRSREHVFPGSQHPAEIEMTPKQLATMALQILDYFNVLDLTAES